MINKKEQKSRNTALWIIGVMIVIWIILGVFSFTDSGDRKRPQSTEISFAGQSALRGKQVFQAYNCMDCHTIVGNGAYFAPDLTKIYEETGPAWLKAYLSSPATYPTKPIVNIQLQQMYKDGLVETDNMDDYYDEFGDAERRIENRGGADALMPNLPFSKDEIDALIAFFKYTAKINTAGWPPEVKANKKIVEQKRMELERKSGAKNAKISVLGTASESEGEEMPILTKGKEVAVNLGCMACHSTDGSIKVGPTWKNLFESTVTLDNGKEVLADEDYLKRAILHPDEEIVTGFQDGIMPSYEGLISDEQITDLIAFIKSLK